MRNNLDIKVVRAAATALLVCACVLAVTSGCGGGAASAGNEAEVRAVMVILGREYGSYLAEHNEAPPSDEAAMRGYLQSRLGELNAYGVKSVDDLLRAGRDGEPIQVVYGAKIAVRDSPDYSWAAYEKAGVDGVRLACDSRGGVHKLAQDDFAAQIPGK